MSIRTRYLASVSCLLVLMVVTSSVAQQKGSKDEFMQKKLEQSQRILEGLTTDNFELIAANAKAMSTLTALEKWLGADTPEYQAQLKMFQLANQELVRNAEEQNLDGAALAYVQLTLTCVNCHKQLRVK